MEPVSEGAGGGEWRSSRIRAGARGRCPRPVTPCRQREHRQTARRR